MKLMLLVILLTWGMTATAETMCGRLSQVNGYEDISSLVFKNLAKYSDDPSTKDINESYWSVFLNNQKTGDVNFVSLISSLVNTYSVRKQLKPASLEGYLGMNPWDLNLYVCIEGYKTSITDRFGSGGSKKEIRAYNIEKMNANIHRQPVIGDVSSGKTYSVAKAALALQLINAVESYEEKIKMIKKELDENVDPDLVTELENLGKK